MRMKASEPEPKGVDIGGILAAVGICLLAGGASSLMLIASWNLLV